MAAFQQLLLALTTTAGSGGSAVVSLQDGVSLFSQAQSYNGQGATVSVGFTVGNNARFVSDTTASGDFTLQSDPVDYLWLTGGVTSNYSVRATVISGSPLDIPSEPTGVWLPLSSSRRWALFSAVGSSGLEAKSTTVQIEIALTSDLIPLDSTTVSLSTVARSDEGPQP